jgi:hypothetical protein
MRQRRSFGFFIAASPPNCSAAIRRLSNAACATVRSASLAEHFGEVLARVEDIEALRS